MTRNAENMPLWALGYEDVKQLADGRWLMLERMIFNWRLSIGDEWGKEVSWDYPREAHAWRALDDWDGNGVPPYEWVRNVMTGERR